MNQPTESNPSRRQFARRCLSSTALLASLTDRAIQGESLRSDNGAVRDRAHFAPRAKRVILLFMTGGPSQHELFDFKPRLNELDGQPIGDAALSRMKFAQIMEKRPSILGTHVRFRKHGESGAEISELLPCTAGVADDLAIIRTVQATETPHHPAEVYFHTGTRQFGRPSLGAWITWGLGNESSSLPGYVVLNSGMRPRTKGAVWAAGFLSSSYQGVLLRDAGQPILNLSPPPGRTHHDQRRIVQAATRLNALRYLKNADPEVLARSSSLRTANELTLSAPEALDLRAESRSTMELYGADPDVPSFARNCVMARRLVERGVRFVHLCHGDWDHHSHLKEGMASQCRQTDQACAALIRDLKQRGLLEDTLVVWGGEFGRTPVGQKTPGAGIGRDHQISAFTMWMSGGGIRTGQTLGETDELGFLPVTRPLPIHDIHATILHQLGLDHRRLTFHTQGRDFRLTDVAGELIPELIG